MLMRPSNRQNVGCLWGILGTGMLTLLAFALATPALANQPSFVVMARKGDPIPGQATGHVWNYVGGNPAINNNGQIVFRAQIGRPDASYLNGIWFGEPNEYHQIAYEGQPAHGTDADFTEIEDGYITDDGYVAFWSFLTPIENKVQYGSFIATIDSLQMVARTGLNPPGTPQNVTYTYTAVPHLATQGKLAQYASYDQPGAKEHKAGLWAGRVGSLDYVMRSLAQAPDAAAGSIFLIGHNGFDINSSGHVLFGGTTSGDPYNGIWLFDGRETRLVKARGKDYDIDGNPAVFGRFQVYNYRDDGRATFLSTVPDLGSSLWFGELDAPRCLVAEGDAAIDLGSDIYFAWIGPNRWDDAGGVALQAILTGNDVDDANDTSIWSVTPEQLQFTTQQAGPTPGVTSDDTKETSDAPIGPVAPGKPLFIVREGDPAPGGQPYPEPGARRWRVFRPI